MIESLPAHSTTKDTALSLDYDQLCDNCGCREYDALFANRDYILLKSARPARLRRTGLWDLCVTAVMLAPLTVIGTLAEAAACARGRGSIVKIVAANP